MANAMLVSLTTDWAKDKNNGQLIMGQLTIS